MKKISVLGSISTDFVVETAVRPQVGETVEGNEFSTSFGGKGANQAVASSRLGAQVSMIGAVGEDTFGDELLKNLEQNGVFTGDVERVTQSSGSAFIVLQDGDNSIIYVPGANGAYTKEHLKALSQPGGTLETTDMVLVQNETPQAVVEELIRTCQDKDIPLLYNPAPARVIAHEWVEKVAFLTPNETEFAVMFPNESMDDVLKQYPNKLIVTLGDKGAKFFDGEEIKLVPSVKVDKVVDTTGAGDTFNGSFAFAYAHGLDIRNSIKFANLAAALSIQKAGAQGGAPTLEEMKGQDAYEETWHFE